MLWTAAIFLWIIILEALSILAFPIVYSFSEKLADKGYAVSKLFGLLLSSYICFILSFATGFGLPLVIFSVANLAAISLFFFMLNRKNICLLLRDRDFLRTVFFIEAVFLLTFVSFSILRAYDPAVNDGEKQMEFAFVNAVARAERFPPPYPWYSGESLGTYYYYGHYLTAFMSIISGIPTSISYNLALAMFFALTAVLSFSFGMNMTRKPLFGIIAVFFVLFMANIFIPLQLASCVLPIEKNLSIEGYEPPHGGVNEILRGGSGVWWSTRIIPWTINEFPFFTFIWADLHHSLMSIPFRIMIMVMALGVILTGPNLFALGNKSLQHSIPAILAISLSLGVLVPLSAWDFPIMIFFVSITIFASFMMHSKSLKKGLFMALPIILMLVLLSMLLFFPVYGDLFGGRAEKIKIEDQVTSLYHFLILFSAFLFLILSYLFVLWKNSPKKRIKIENMDLIMIKYLLYLFLFYLFLLGKQISIVILFIVFLGIESLAKKISKDDVLAIIAILSGALLAILCELINIGGRYISLFKFYLELWTFWAIASAYALFFMRSRIKKSFIRKTPATSKIWWISVVLLIALCSIYMFVAVNQEILNQIDSKSYVPTLDSTAYINLSHPHDFEAIEWININIKGSPVILEAPGRSYTYTSRVSWLTGLPTVLGWEHHAENHLSISYTEMMSGRNADIDEIYNTTDNVRALELLNKYNVSYIYVGELEHKYDGMLRDGKPEMKTYNPNGLIKFSLYPEDYAIIYNDSYVQIYKVLNK